MTRQRRWLAIALLTSATGCAWSNPANRPVWNAFEAHLVPTNDVAFYAALPLTIPGGLAAILTDTLVVHPARVIDDAAGDAADLWRGVDFTERYYTELGFLPLRAAWTPVVFVTMFAGRSIFDVKPHTTHAEREARARALATERQADAAAARTNLLAFFAALARGDDAAMPELDDELPRDAELDDAFAAALRGARAAGRHLLYHIGRVHRFPPLDREPWLGLTDADPVVRYLELSIVSRDRVPAAVLDRLLGDANEMVRALAREKFAGAGR